MQLRVSAKKHIFDQFVPPADKSLTHRALLFGSIASGTSEIENGLTSEDAHATQECLTLLGNNFVDQSGKMQVVPGAEWKQPEQVLPCGNSGTTTRLISGLIASRNMTATLVGDASLSRRPMKRIKEPLELMGAKIEGEHLPMTLNGSANLTAIRYESPVASAQIKSCILLAGLRADGATSVEEPSLSRDHTERMLTSLGVQVKTEELESGKALVTIVPQNQLPGFHFRVPGDISSSAFFLTAGVLFNREMTAISVGVNPTRSGLLDVLKQVGCDIQISEIRLEMGEPVANVTLSPRGRHPFEIKGNLVPRLIDEIPILAILATQLNGVSSIRDASELRVKESDRIERIASGIRALGGKVEIFEDGMAIEGPTTLVGGHINADGDHRIAMSFAIAGLICKEEVVIDGAETVATSYPQFFSELERIHS